MVVKLPAKNVPSALSHLIEVYRRDRTASEGLQAFITRVGKVALKKELIPYSILPPYEQDSSYYIDWEADQEFSVEDLGPGECAGGALEMIDNRILEADQELYQAKLSAEKHQHGFAVNKAYRAVIAAAKAILVTEGIDPNTDADTLAELDRVLASKGNIIPASYRNLAPQVEDLGPKDPTAEFTKTKIAFALGFVDACRTATEELGQDLKLGVEEVGQDQSSTKQETSTTNGATGKEESAAPVLDLRGVMCPLNYVKTKLRLEMMDDGDQLEVWLDAGDPIKNVPMSLRNDGHKVLAEDPLEAAAEHFKVLVEKVEA